MCANSFFNILYEYKKTYLMTEAYLDHSHATDVIKPEISCVEKTDTMLKLIHVIKHTTDKLMKCIPAKIAKEWAYADYTAYTDVYYHRRFWNEIPNDEITKKALDQFLKISKPVGYIEKQSEHSYLIYVYDFNDKELMFDNEEHLTQFITQYGIAPATIFACHNGMWIEQYSI